jgi:aerobic carbon-monoxide dehydrogenase medium subunit
MLVGLRSRRQIEPFSLHRPATLAEAVALHRQPGVSAFFAGGIDLIDWLKHGHAIDRLVRLDGLPELAEITGGADQLRIGAMVTHAAIAGSPVIQELLPGLSMLWHKVANPRVRFVGTIGGNVMARRSDYDGPPALLASGAQAEIAADVGTQRAPLDGIDGLVIAFVIPAPTTQRLFTDRSLRPALSVWLGLTVMDGHVAALRVAVGMAHPAAVCVMLTPNVPVAALGSQSASLAEQVIERLPEPMTDGLATASYRRRMVGVLTRRILLRAGDSG